MAAIPPSLVDVRAWIQVPATLISDEQLQIVINAEVLLQAKLCTIAEDPTGWPADLRQAIYRRVAREIAAKGIPLGTFGADSEYGPARLSRWDAEIGRLEGPSRKVVFG